MSKFRTPLLFTLLCLLSVAAGALELAEVLDSSDPATLYPGADHIELATEDEHLAVAYAGAQRIGTLFLNSSFANAIGYSGKPINILVGLDNDGVLQAAHLVEHHEPIVLIGIPESKILEFLAEYTGLDAAGLVRGEPHETVYDAVSGATVTIRVIDDSIIRAAAQVAQLRGLGGLQLQETAAEDEPRTLLQSEPEQRPWSALLEDGSIARLRLTYAEVRRAFADADKFVAVEQLAQQDPNGVFIDLYTAPLTVPTLGLSLLGEAEYENLRTALEDGRHAVLVAASGDYSFKGSGYVRGGIFDRFEIIQRDNVVRFRDIDHERLRRIAAAGAPALPDVDVFLIPEGVEFDPARNWQLELLISEAIGAREKAFISVGVGYEIPDRYLEKLEPDPRERLFEDGGGVLGRQPLWQSLWMEKLPAITVLLVALTALTAAFFFQIQLAHRPQFLARFRIAFLLFTLFGIGWYGNAQLSVVNVLTVCNALVTGFDWGYFLIEPLIFILWGGVAAGLIFWGRGAYCGWLCPFGALQELMSEGAKRLGVKQITIKWEIHERLWAIKYLLFLGLLGASIHSLELSERLAEVEPFKTAIIFKFVREWPFVLFALALLAPGLFIERFYCRYLCPLGAALAIPGRLRMFEWLKRYRQCGHPCQQCANECMVQSIHPEGHINPNECMHCMHCQQLYFDDQRCPVVAQKKLKKERRSARVTPETKAVAERVFEMLKADREAQRKRDEAI